MPTEQVEQNQEIEVRVKAARAAKNLSKSLSIPRQSVIDAYIDLGPDASYEAIGAATKYPAKLVEKIFNKKGFKSLLRRRLVQRGFTADVQREQTNEIVEMGMSRIYNILKTKTRLTKEQCYTLRIVNEVIGGVEGAAGNRMKSEEIQQNLHSDDYRKALNTKEAMQRMRASRAFKKQPKLTEAAEVEEVTPTNGVEQESAT